MDDMDLSIPPRRHEEPVEADVTMPGKRDRKPDGRFDIGDLVMKRYKVLAELGQGGMGVVYKCFDETAGIEVALKALPPELSHNTLEMEDIKDNFQLVHNLHHPNIASSNTLEKDNSNGNYYLIMECCEGEDLRRWLKRKRKDGEITLDDILPIVKQVADALDYAHEMKIIHRDIKPGNIMIDQFGKIKVLDFGLAAQIHTSMTRVSMAYYGTSGTGPYMAPEQWRGRAQGAAADQYALAVMTYEMLAGRLPFESTDASVLREAVLNDCPEDIADIPKSAQGAIKRAMCKEPTERFDSCSDFVAALGGKKVKSANVQKKGNSEKWIAAVLAVILLGGVGIYFSGKEKQPPVVPPAPVEPVDSISNEEVHETEAKEFDGIIYLPNGVKLEMIKVAKGSFTMSRRDGENESNEVEHTKTLTQDFYIGKYEVTQAQWEVIMITGIREQRDKDESSSLPLRGVGEQYPMGYVDWHEAMSFCDNMNKYAPAGWRFTLPTETQWEFAARGGNKGRNYKYSGSNNIDEVAWYIGNSKGEIHQVGTKLPNELGLYDMSGNVGEWCLDNWSRKSNETKAEFSRPYSDNDSSYRVYRGLGGSDAKYCRSAKRDGTHHKVRLDGLGFRLALVPIK